MFNENLTWIRGRHSLKFGTEIRREQFTIFQISSPRGDMLFGPDFTDNPGMPNTGGVDFASFLLGIPDSADLASLRNVDYHRKTFAFFGQDDIQVNNRLTLNLGLRYEVFRPVTEGHNEMATFDFRSDSLIVPSGQNAQLTPTIASFIPIQRNASARPDQPRLHRRRAPRGSRFQDQRQTGATQRLRNFLWRAGERSVFVPQSRLQSTIF